MTAKSDVRKGKVTFFVMENTNETPTEGVIINSKPETELRRSDFHYDLPQELIAQHPSKVRDASRLLVVDRATGKMAHRHFRDIVDYLQAGDTLVINNSKVIPARLYGHADGRPEAQVELLLLRARGLDSWECLVKPGKRARVGDVMVFGDGMLIGRVEELVEEGNRIIHFDYDHEKYPNVYEILHEIGQMPLPPYITEQQEDNSRYQTVYAREEGSAAAPTAGLHFTKALLEHCMDYGIAVVPVMLHVGLGTFRPVKEDRIDQHIMHTEYFSVSQRSADIINKRRELGGRIICVGTTSCRTLESAADENGIIHPMSGETGIFIYPGYKFKATDGLITNFHLPESTLLMLVSAFWTREDILRTYEEAVRKHYRFFSFGDAMFIQ